ncbi:MAG: lytic transglycosylase [Nocardioides sp.]|nr:lytic transglycosylase [Nocardioides sp.]
MSRRRLLPAAALALALGVSGCAATSDPTAPPADAAGTDGAGSADRTGQAGGTTGRDPVALALADGVRRPAGPRQAARMLVAAEDAIAGPATGSARLRTAGHLAQVVYREIGEHPGWDRRVHAAVPRRLHRVLDHNVASRREFRSMHYTLSDTLPAWRIVEPAPARVLMRSYREAERRFGVDWEYLAAINVVETATGRIRGTSVAGAQGPMQFMPATWAAYGRGDVDDPHDAIQAAGRYLQAMGFRSGPGGAGARATALYRYNNHMAYVRGVTHLAQVMQQRPRAFLGYRAWEVYYLSAAGDVLLPVGYDHDEPVPVRRYVRNHPQDPRA